MYGISPKLPVTVDDLDGHYALTKTIREAIKQNFKNLMFTIPGEKVMDIDFGVGLKRYLFENFDANLVSRLSGRIRSQTQKYMPFILLKNVDISKGEANDNRMNVRISYSISNLGSDDELLLTLSNTN